MLIVECQIRQHLFAPFLVGKCRNCFYGKQKREMQGISNSLHQGLFLSDYDNASHFSEFCDFCEITISETTK